MSFSSAAKSEICRQELLSDCCEQAELTALLHTAGSISISGGSLALRLDTEHAAIARRAFQIVKSLYGVGAKMEMHTNRLKQNHIYSLLIDRVTAQTVALDTHLMDEDGIHTSAEAASMQHCCAIAFVRGAFLGGGSVTNPERSYHMEFVCSQKDFAQELLNIINQLGITAKMISRNQSFVVYLKESDAIVTLLTMIGAHVAILSMENIRILKSVRNSVNRKVNCDSGNLSKTVNASVQQHENIEAIKACLGLDKLSAPLREIAEARINFPEATLGELAEMTGNSKSAVNHRLRKLGSIALQLKNTRG
jgi:cell division protein WhiA